MSEASDKVLDKDNTTSVADKDVFEKDISEKKPSIVDTTSPQKNEEEQSTVVDIEEEIEYPTGFRLLLISISICLAVFCMALDNTIIATAIPRITDYFKALDDVGYYISMYLLTTCAFQLMFGKLYTFYSVKWVFLIALAIFEVGSVICGAAPTSNTLIAGRAIAGFGAAGIFSGAILIISYSVPLIQRPVYIGIIGAVYGVSSVVGPLLGGAFTDNPHLTWRWCFYINLPFGAVTAIFLFFFFKSPKKQSATNLTILQQLDQMDVPGTFFFLPGVVCLLLTLQWGGTTYPWNNGRIIALFVLAGLLLSGFVAVQFIRGDKATVPPRIFLQRSIWGCATYAALVGGAFFIVLYYLPIWFQAIKGASAVASGIRILPLVLSLVFISILGGAGVTFLGYYNPWMIFCVIVMPIGAGLLSTLSPDDGSAKWIGYQIIFGLGIGSGFQQPLVVAQSNLPLADVPIGTAIMMFFQIFGGSLMSSVAQNIFSNQLVKNVGSVSGLAPGFINGIGATEIRSRVPPELLPSVIAAYSKSLNQTFYVAVAVSALAFFPMMFIKWTNVKGMKFSPAAA